MNAKDKEAFDNFLNMPKEDLDPELKRCLAKGHFSPKMIGHHFVHEIFYIPEHNYRYNQQLKFKKERYAEAVEEKNWSSALFLYEKPYRLLAFSKIHTLMSNQDYWSYLKSIWVDSENIWQHKNYWLMYLSSDRPMRQYFMEAEEIMAIKELPEKIVVYRGYCKGKNRNGFSWTLSKEKAEFFANRYKGIYKPGVAEKTISKDEIFAYISDRNEEEVILLPRRKQK